MKFDLERRIDNAVKRLHARIDSMAQLGRMAMKAHAEDEHKKLHEAFNTAARSIGQSRRQRNQRGVIT